MDKKIFSDILKEFIQFEESYEIKGKCPKPNCGGEVIRHISKEHQQGWGGRWFIEYCTESDCDYISCGFTPANYKPSTEVKKIE